MGCLTKTLWKLGLIPCEQQGEKDLQVSFKTNESYGPCWEQGKKVISPAPFHAQCFAAQPSLCISCVRRKKLITLPVLPRGGTTIYKSGVLLTQYLPHPQAVISLTQNGL